MLKLRFVVGWKLFFLRFLFLFSLGKYFFQKKKYPLFKLKIFKGGYFNKSYKLPKDLNLSKAVQFGKHFHLTLVMPHFPSPVFDRMVANGGLNVSEAGSPAKRQVDYAILGITQRCNLSCSHCYEAFSIDKKNTISIQRWKKTIKTLQEKGVSIIVLSGGEPMLRFDGVIDLLKSGDKSRSDFHIHTSGDGVNEQGALALKRAGLYAAGVSLDDYDPHRHDAFRNTPGLFQKAINAIGCFKRAGIFTYLNLCLTAEMLKEENLWNYFELAKELGVGIIQLLEPKPVGKFINKKNEIALSKSEKTIVVDFYLRGNKQKKYRDYPLIFYPAYMEQPNRMGCLMGGLSHLYIDCKGNVNPCTFLPVSFGNIQNEPLTDILLKMRKAIPHPLHLECPSFHLADSIGKKIGKGFDSTVPYEHIKKEWETMYEA